MHKAILHRATPQMYINYMYMHVHADVHTCKLHVHVHVDVYKIHVHGLAQTEEGVPGARGGGWSESRGCDHGNAHLFVE